MIDPSDPRGTPSKFDITVTDDYSQMKTNLGMLSEA